MTTEHVRLTRLIGKSACTLVALLVAIFVASVAGVSAHVVRGVMNPTFVTGFVSVRQEARMRRSN